MNLFLRMVYLTALLGVFAAQSALAKEISAVVIHDSTQTYKSGAVIDPKDVFQLKQGDKLSIALSSGKTKTIEGPFSGKGADLDKSSSKIRNWKKLLADLTQREGPSNVIGGVRDLDASSILYLNEIPSQVFCVSPTHMLSTELNEREVRIKSNLTGISITLPPGKEVVWPNFYGSGKYSILNEDGLVTIETKILNEYSLSELVNNQCTAQYDQLLARIITNASN